MTHFMIYNYSIYDHILKLDENKELIDRFWHYKYNAIIPYPFIAWQCGGYSDIYQCDLTRKYKLYLNSIEKLTD